MDLGKAPSGVTSFFPFAVLRKDFQPSTGISALNNRRTQNILHKHVLREVVRTNNSGQKSKYIQRISRSVSHRSMYLSISKHFTLNKTESVQLNFDMYTCSNQNVCSSPFVPHLFQSVHYPMTLRLKTQAKS